VACTGYNFTRPFCIAFSSH